MVCFKVANTQLQNLKREVRHLWTTEALWGRTTAGLRASTGVRPSEARRERRSGRATFVVVMQTADVWE
jgi:hypothetical protein